MNHNFKVINSPESPELASLCDRLRELANGESSKRNRGWPADQLDLIRQSGVYRWFVPKSLGGLGWSSEQIVAGYIELASACLTTTFIITQRVAAIRRICQSDNELIRDRLLMGLMTGSEPATIGISHLTTSRRHVREPVLKATESDDGFVINGFSPWVTGASHASSLVMGAEQTDGSQILFVVASDAAGVTVESGFDLVALSGSQTGPVKCENVSVKTESILAGPIQNVLTSAGTPSTGSIQTSSLAIGLAQAAVNFIAGEAANRPDLNSTLEALVEQLGEIRERLLKLAAGVPICSNEELRSDANSLVLRATQAALVAAKGTGYVTGHPVGRWCQEALFFLVWSCPQAVLNANLCELAGIES